MFEKKESADVKGLLLLTERSMTGGKAKGDKSRIREKSVQHKQRKGRWRVQKKIRDQATGSCIPTAFKC